jgi:arylsulfatase A-like enzyme
MAPLRGCKATCYEGGIRVPLIVRWPGVIQPGSLCHEPVIRNDFYPTALDIAGLPPRPEQHCDGLSLLPLLKGAERLDRDALYWHYPHYHRPAKPHGAVRARRWKLLEFFEDNRVELYDLETDIGERNNLAKEKPEKAAELRQMLHAWRDRVGAQMPRPA